MAKSVSLCGDLVSDACPPKLPVETKVWSELHKRCQNEESSDMISGNVMFLRDSRHQTDSTADGRSYLFRRGPQLNIGIAVTSHVQTRFNALCHSNVSVFPQTQTHHLKADIHSSLQMFLIQLLLQAVILIITYCVRVVLADCFYMLSNAIKIKFLPSLDPRRCLLALLRLKFTSESLPTSRPRRSTVVLIYPLIVSWWI